ncbi:MAG: hypothetical protein Q9217_003540 [Psora testacea]
MSPFFATKLFSSRFVPGRRSLHLSELPKKNNIDVEQHAGIFSPRPSPAFPALQHALGHCLTIKLTEGSVKAPVVVPDSDDGSSPSRQASQTAADLEKQDITDADLEVDKEPATTPEPAIPNAGSGESKTSKYWIEQYEPLKTLNAGSEGTCTLVKHRQTCKLFALKVVSDPRLIDNKPNEVALLDTLSLRSHPHKNIIHIEAWAYNTSLYTPYAEYYLPYYPLGDLCDFMSRYQGQSTPIPELFIWKTYLQLASALEYLHRGFYVKSEDRHNQHQHQQQQSGLVHRDIKPENILLRASPQAISHNANGNMSTTQTHLSTLPDLILADFGHATRQEFTYTPCGTDIWRAPELPRSSPRSDVWAMGAVIHTLAHFYPPIAPLPAHFPQTKHDQEMWERKAEARQPDLDLPGFYSRDLGRVLGLALRVEEGRRPYAGFILEKVEAGLEGVLSRGIVGF